ALNIPACRQAGMFNAQCPINRLLIFSCYTNTIFMKKILFFLSLVLTLTSFSQPPTDSRLKGLDTFALRILKEWNAPGVAIAVVEKNKVVYTGGFGYRDFEKKLPVTQNTLFAIGSCTKAFTASILGMLEKEGKLSIDKPVRDYLPELVFKNDYTNKHATLRDMMCHRTGLPRHDYSWYGSTASRNELLERVRYQEPTFELREKYQYNNFMFLAQGMVIEKITGKSWEENMRERIFKPLGMISTNLSVIDLEKSPDRSLAYSSAENKIKAIPYRNIDAIGPAGSINSCAKDMANWLITWINDGKFNGKEIIPPAYRADAITAQISPGGGLPGSENPDLHMSGYGLGWGVSSYRGHYRVEHGGGIDGFITSTSFFPSDSIGIFVVSNQGTPTTSIRNFIADRMLRLSYRPWGKTALADKLKAELTAKAAPNADSINRKPGTKYSHDIADYNGEFENKGYGVIKIFRERDTSWVDYNEAGKRTKSYLEHHHYDIFRIRSTEETENPKTAPKIRFNTDEKGNIASLEIQMEPSVKDILFERLAPAVAKAELEKYTGDYDLSGTNVKVHIKGDKTLMVFIPGQTDYELVPAGKDEFDLKIAKGYSVKFEVNAQNKVLSLTFIQPNGNFKARKKNQD
ncbi:MAG TPA: serine hydrolase, partial [Chitinophagaceae bacterium]|nr:serine hydrolase [Chitinophagaceae bacterium]